MREKCLEFAIILQSKMGIKFNEIAEGLRVGEFDFPTELEAEELRIFSLEFTEDQRNEIIASIIEDGMQFKYPCYVFYLAHIIYHALFDEKRAEGTTCH